MGAIIRFTFSSFKTQQMSKEKKRTSRHLQYNKKVKSLKVNFLWQVHNLKQKQSLVQVWRCCAEVVFLEAEVRGSVSYTVNGSQSIHPLDSWRRRRRFHFAVLCSPSPCSPACVTVVQFQTKIVSVCFSFPAIVQVGGRMRHCVCDGICVQSTITEVLHLH